MLVNFCFEFGDFNSWFLGLAIWYDVRIFAPEIVSQESWDDESTNAIVRLNPWRDERMLLKLVGEFFYR